MLGRNEQIVPDANETSVMLDIPDPSFKGPF
jgi:hypothetical protein